MMSDREKTCRAITFILVAVLIFSLLFAYIYYLDLKKTFILRLSGKASSLAGQQINIGDISFGLLSGVNVHDIQIQNPEGFETGQLLKINRISLNMNYRELFDGKLHFSHIYIYAPELTVIKNREGRLNISDEFKRFLSKKGTLKYVVDEFRISSGTADFNYDNRLRNDRINLVLKNLSSSPGTKTLIQGDTMWSGENRVRLDGWANLSDEGKKFRISVSAEDFRLSPFMEMLAGYQIDLEKTRMRMRLDAEGDTANGVKITSGILIKSPGYGFYKKKLIDITLDAALFYDISASSATINMLTVKVGEASALWLKGRIEDLSEKPAYNFEMKIDSLDLSAFNIVRGFKTSGIVSSSAINIKGIFDYSLPELNGLIQMEGVSVTSDAVDVKNINGRMIFSSAKDIAAKIEASAELLNAGGYSFSRPVAVRLSLNAKGRQRNLALSAVINTSPLEMKINKEKELWLGDFRVSMDGMLKGNAFSGKSTANSESIRFNEYSFKKLICGFEFNYSKGSIAINNPKVVTDVFSSSADTVKIGMPGKKDSFLIEAKNLNAAYPVKKAGLQGLDFSATLNTPGKNIFGDILFSARGGMFQEVKSGKISGIIKFNEREFSFDIPQAEFAGGRIRVIAQGKTSQGPFPLKAEVTAEHLDLGEISLAAEKHLQSGYLVSGNMESLSFKGTIDSKESLRGETALDLQRLSVLNTKTKKLMFKGASMRTDVTFNGKDCEFKTAASAGALSTTVSGSAKGFMSEGRSVHIQGYLNEIPLNEIRNTFWDMFPDSLLYAGMDGSVSSDFKLEYRKEGAAFGGDLRLKDFVLKGENNEYSVGPVNGVVPFAYGKFGERGKTVALPSFERSEFAVISRHYADEQPGVDYNRITMGSLQYGFRLLEDITVWIKQDGSILNVGRFSANIFGGRLNGSAVIDLSDGLHYRAGMVLQGLSLTKLCDDIEPIKGYLSGKVDGIGLLKGSGSGLQELIGRADFWTYSTKDEKTKISREFLQKIGGPSIKSYVRDRNFNKGSMSFYVQNGFLVFRDLEIANRNLLGIQDLSVKVAPLNNRISIDHLMWTLVEAAERAKKNNE